jgi:hypothetical protein
MTNRKPLNLPDPGQSILLLVLLTVLGLCLGLTVLLFCEDTANYGSDLVQEFKPK